MVTVLLLCLVDNEKIQYVRWPFRWPCGCAGAIQHTFPDRACPGLHAEPLNISIRRLFTPYHPGTSAMVIDSGNTTNTIKKNFQLAIRILFYQFKIPHPCHRRTFLWCFMRKRVGEGFQHAFRKQKSITYYKPMSLLAPGHFQKKHLAGVMQCLTFGGNFSKTIWRELFPKTFSGNF